MRNFFRHCANHYNNPSPNLLTPPSPEISPKILHSLIPLDGSNLIQTTWTMIDQKNNHLPLAIVQKQNQQTPSSPLSTPTPKEMRCFQHEDWHSWVTLNIWWANSNAHKVYKWRNETSNSQQILSRSYWNHHQSNGGHIPNVKLYPTPEKKAAEITPVFCPPPLPGCFRFRLYNTKKKWEWERVLQNICNSHFYRCLFCFLYIYFMFG